MPTINEKKLNDTRKKISQRLAQVSLMKDLTEAKLDEMNQWMSTQINLMEGYIKAHWLETGVELTDYADSIQRFRDKIQELGSQFKTPSTKHEFTQPLSPKVQASFREWEERATAPDAPKQKREQQPGTAAAGASTNRKAAAGAFTSRKEFTKAVGEQRKASKGLGATPEAVQKHEQGARRIEEWLSQDVNRQNPKDKATHTKLHQAPAKGHKDPHIALSVPKSLKARDELIDAEIEKLSQALDRMANSMPQLHNVAINIKLRIRDFQASAKDQNALFALNQNCSALLHNERKTMKNDPLLTRVFHTLVTTVKAFLNWLDWVQSKITGKMIDKPGRNHMLKTPALPAAEAKLRLNTFETALKTMHSELELVVQKGMIAPK